MNKPKILVTGTGSLIGQAIIKSILNSSIRENVTLFGCDYFEGTVGSYWCERNFVLPDILNPLEIENWKEEIYNIVIQQKIEIIFVGVDFELLYFADMKEDLEEKFQCTVVVSDREVIEIGNDKYRTFKFLSDNKIQAPQTCLIEDLSNTSFEYPFIVKPRIGARSRGVRIIRNKVEADLFCNQHINQGYIAQELVGTDNTEYTCGVLCWNGDCVHSIVLKRKLKEGNTMVAEYDENEERNITQYIRDIATRLKPYGSCNLQLRVDDKGQPKLFEINPRFSGTTYMRALFGYNEVAFIICKILGWEESSLIKKNGKVIRYYEERLIQN